MHIRTTLPLLAAISALAPNALATQPAEPVTPAASGEEADAPSETFRGTGPGWTVRVEPSLAFLAPAGDLRLPSSTTRGGEYKLDTLNLDSPRLAPFGRVMAARGSWRFSFSGLGFSADDQGATATGSGQIGGAAFFAGDRLVSDLSYQAFEITASYRLAHRRSEVGNDGEPKAQGGIDLVGGLRMHHADFDVRVLPGVAPFSRTPSSADADELFAEPVIGLRGEAQFGRSFGIDVESLAGGFTTGDRTSISFSIDAGFVYRPIPSVGLRVGYHLLVFDLEDGDGADEFSWNGSVAGLYWGAQFSF
jgi:hypothetical protein